MEGIFSPKSLFLTFRKDLESIGVALRGFEVHASIACKSSFDDSLLVPSGATSFEGVPMFRRVLNVYLDKYLDIIVCFDEF